MDILALLQCLQPAVSRTTLRQFSRIVVALLVMTGRVTMLGISRWAGQGGSYRTVQRFFSQALPWAMLFWCSFVSISTVLLRSTCWWAMKSWPPKRVNTPMAWTGSFPVCMASRCQGWPSSRYPWSAPSNGARFRSASSRSCAVTQKKRPARPKRTPRSGTLHRQAPSRASKRQQEHSQS